MVLLTIKLWLAGALLAASPGFGALDSVQLPDQYGGEDSLAQHRGSAVVALVVDARRMGTVRRWAEDLTTRFPGVHLLMVADVNERRPVTLERVSVVLARRVPAGARVLIDMDRQWARHFELDTAVPNLLLVAADGELIGQFRGRWSETLANEVGARLALVEGGT